VVSLSDGSHLYIALGTDHQLWIRSDTLVWQNLAPSIRLYCIDNPAATLSGSTLVVACQGGDHALYSMTAAIPPAGLPVVTGFTPLGGLTLYGPAVAVVNGTLTYFVVGTDGRPWWRTESQGWSPLSAWCTGHLGLATSGATSYLACHGGDNALWVSTNSGSGWSGFSSLGGTLIDGPAVAGTSSGPVYVVEGTDGAVWQTTGSGWQPVGGGILSGTAATAP